MEKKLMRGSTDLEAACGGPIAKHELRDIYRSALGKLMFVATMTRPDIATTLSQLASFAEHPSYAHLQVLHDCARYLHSHRWPLRLGGAELKKWLTNSSNGPAAITLYADASWRATGTMELTSRTGFIVCIPGLPLVWKSRDQKRTADSAADAEITALLSGILDAAWHGSLLKSVGLVDKFFIDSFTDCDSARKPCVAAVPKPHKLTSAIAKLATIRQLIILDNVLRLSRIEGTENPADILTKDLKGGGHIAAAQRLTFLNTDKCDGGVILEENNC